MSCLSLYLGTVLKVWYVLFIIIFRNCSEGNDMSCLSLYLGTVPEGNGMSCLSLYLGTVPEGVVCLVYHYI